MKIVHRLNLIALLISIFASSPSLAANYIQCSGVGDKNADGFPDILVSQPFDSTGDEDAPSNGFRVISGSDFSTLLDVLP